MSLRRSFMLGLATFAIALAVAPAASATGGPAAGDVHAGGQRRHDRQGRRGRRARRRAADGVGHQGRCRPDRERARQAGRRRRQGHAQAQQEGPDGDRAGAPRWPPAASTSGARGTSRAASATSCIDVAAQQPAARQARGARADASGPRADRAEGHAGRPARCPTDRGRRCCTRRTSTRASGSASRSTAACCTTSSTRWRANDKAIKDLLKTHRAVVRHLREPGRLPVHVRRRAAVAQEPARQQRRRRRSPSATASTPTATSPSTGATTTRARRRTRRTRPTAARAPASEPETQAMAGPDRPHQAEVPVEPALVRPVAPVPAGLAGRHARRRQPDLRRARRHSTPTRRSRASTRASRPTRCTSPTARRPTTPTRRAGTVAYTPELGEGDPGRGLRVPGRRGADPGGVREDAAVPPGPREVGRAPRDAGLAGRASTSSRSTSTHDDIDPQNGQQSLFDFKFGVSYGDPQEVRVLAKRSLGAVTLQLPGQRRRGAERADQRVERRRALRPRQRDLLPRDAGHGDRAPPRATA